MRSQVANTKMENLDLASSLKTLELAQKTVYAEHLRLQEDNRELKTELDHLRSQDENLKIKLDRQRGRIAHIFESNS